MAVETLDDSNFKDALDGADLAVVDFYAVQLVLRKATSFFLTI